MVSWQTFPSLPPRFSPALNSTSLLFQTPATQAIVQSWNFDLYMGGEASKLINFSQCKKNSELDFTPKKDKVSTVFKKPTETHVGETSRDIFISKLVCKVTRKLCKLLLYPDFRSFLKTLAQIASKFHRCCACSSYVCGSVILGNLSTRLFCDGDGDGDGDRK